MVKQFIGEIGNNDILWWFLRDTQTQRIDVYVQHFFRLLRPKREEEKK